MSSTATRPLTSPDTVASVIGGLAVLGTIGAAVMSIAHFGVPIPLLGDFGPGRVLLPVAIGFMVGTVLYALVAYGAFQRTSWAWATGLVVNALAFASAVMPWRGAFSGVAGAVSLAAVLLLVSRPGRAGLLYRQ